MVKKQILDFDKIQNSRKQFIINNSQKDHVVINSLANVLISAPHGVRQLRLGKIKGREIGSLATALFLKESTPSSFIAKTRNNNDDANFDEISDYKNSIISIIKTNFANALKNFSKKNSICMQYTFKRQKRKRFTQKLLTMRKFKPFSTNFYLLDFHGLSSKRNCDINLGTHLGKNIRSDEKSFDLLLELLKKENFFIQIDAPFMAGSRTLSGSLKNKYPHIFSLQIEIRCDITNKKENFNRFKKLLRVFTLWINNLVKSMKIN